MITNRPNTLSEIRCEMASERIESLLLQYQTEKLLLSPPFQRYFVWNRVKASVLIESIIMGIPLPLAYLSRESDGKLYVVDGKQRFTSIFSYISETWPNDDRPFTLEGVDNLDLLGKTFTQLPVSYQSRILDTILHVALIKEPDNPELKYTIFARLNQSPTPLNDMEMRNSIFQGTYLNLIKRLASLPELDTILRLGIYQRRDMRYEEMVMRFTSLWHTPPEQYEDPLKRFLNEDMKKYQDAPVEHMQELEHFFIQGLNNAIEIFGNRAFRRYFPGNRVEPNGHWNRSVNKPLFECMIHILAKYKPEEIVPYAASIREAYIVLLTSNEQLIENMEYRGGSYHAGKLRTRFRLLEQFIVDILKSTDVSYRDIFKMNAYSESNTCHYCKRSIQHIDDAGIIDQKNYWIALDEQRPILLAHRYCAFRNEH